MDNTKKTEFLRLFRAIKPERHRHEVWSDFVTTSAIALHNATYQNETLESEYLKIIKAYSTDDIQRLCEMLSLVVSLLDSQPLDILGALYMDLGLSSEQNGQYFTPDPVSQLMAGILHGETLDDKLGQSFITLHEPACGAGGMVLAFAKVVIDKGHNPAEKMWVSAVDINRIAALMAYIQLSLWNIPAEVIVGDTLRMDYRERWYTPAHQLYGWAGRLKWKKMLSGVDDFMAMDKEYEDSILEKVPEEPAPTVESKTGSQVAFDFNLPIE